MNYHSSDLPIDVETYTDFAKLKSILGQNYQGEGDQLYSFLKCMLHHNKRKRKTPAELLTHPFIKEGEEYLQQERARLAAGGNGGPQPETQVSYYAILTMVLVRKD